jgi:hypothetical protein
MILKHGRWTRSRRGGSRQLARFGVLGPTRKTASGRITQTAAAESPEHLGGTDPGHRLKTGTEVARPSEGAEAPPEKSPAPVDSDRRFPDM